MQPPIERIEVSTEELEGLLEQARPALSEDGYQKLRAAIHTLGGGLENGASQRQNQITFWRRTQARENVSGEPLCRFPTTDQQMLPMQNRAIWAYAARRIWTIAL